METDEIGEFAASNNFGKLTKDVKERTKLAVLNFLGVAVGANAYKETSAILRSCQTMQAGEFPIYGSGDRAGLLSSSWANSAMAHYLDFDDTHLGSIVHPSAPVIPGALAFAIEDGATGEEVIYATTMGMEVSIRLGIAVGLDERYSDWHNTSLYGTSASAVTSALMRHGNAEQISSSMLEGLSVATGFLSNRGTVTKSFQVGRSAAEGMISALAVFEGVTVSKNMLNTFAKTLSGNSDLSLLTESLGKKWNVLDNFLKPYPCGVVLHPGIDAAVEMRNRNINLQEAEEINVYVNPIVMVLTAILEPKTGLESKFSITHSMAAALVYGPLFPEHFSDRVVNEPQILRLRKKIKVHQREDVNRGQTILEIKFKDGRKEIVDLNRGAKTPSKHLEMSDVERKFRHLAEPILGVDKARDVWEYFSRLETRKDLTEVKDIF